MPDTRPTGGEHICHGVTWATGDPRLLLAPLPDGPLIYAPVIRHRLGFRTGDGRWCTGRYRFTDTVRVEALACPDRAPAPDGQCARCRANDEFRFAHHAHHDGPVPEALCRYLDQPHWLYLATFADSTTKVGTAAEPRKRSRLDEQGPMHATYIASTTDGHAVRHLEDALSRDLGLRQTVHSATKLKALSALSTLTDLSAVAATHNQAVERAVDALAGMTVPTTVETWTPPTESARLRVADRVRSLYPHDVRMGEHGLTVAACLGTHVLVTVDHDGDSEYVLDLQALKGRRITLGPFSSPAAAMQGALF